MRKARRVISWILVMAMVITNVDYVRATGGSNISAGDVVTGDVSVGDATEGDVSEGNDFESGVSENDISEGDSSFIDVSGDNIVVDEPVNEVNLSATAESTVLYSGSESGVNWQITSDGVLTISGEQTAGSDPITASWLEYKESITSAVITATNITSTARWFSESNVSSIDMSKFDTSKVTSMQGMFYGCINLTSIDVSNFDTSNVTNMGGMFWFCSSLASIDMSNFITSKVTYMAGMFNGCSSLTSVNMSNFDTSNVTDMSNMFYGCNNLTSVDVSNFNTSNVSNMTEMFAFCNNLTSIDLSNFDTSKVVYMNWMFDGCLCIEKIKAFKNLKLETVQLPFKMYDKDGKEYEYFPSNLSEGIWLYANKPEAPEPDEPDSPDTPSIKNSSDTFLVVYDEKTNFPVQGVSVTINNACYKTGENGIIQLVENNKITVYSNVTLSKNGYITKTIDLTVESGKNVVYLEPIVDFKFTLPQAAANIKLENSIDVGGKEIKWLDMDYEVNWDIPVSKIGNKKEEIPINVEYDSEKDTIKITFGVKNTEDKYKAKEIRYDYVKNICEFSKYWGTSKGIHDYLEKHSLMAESTLGVKVTSSIIGYIEIDRKTGQPIESGALAAMKGKGEVTWRPAIGGGLLYITGSVSMSASGQLTVNFENEDVSFQTVLELEQALGITGGLGTPNIHAEVGADVKLNEKLEIPFKNAKESMEVNYSGTVYAELKIFFFKASKDIELFNVELWPGNQSSTSSAITNIMGIDTSQMIMMSRDYNTFATTPLADTYILENVYPDGNARMCELADGTLLAVWIADLGIKSDANRTTLVYSINKGNGWSEAQAICETGRADFSPSLAVSGNKAVLMYTNIDTALTENTNLTEFLDNIDIYTAVYENGTFSTPELLTETNNGIMEFDAQIATNGDEKSVIWVENSNNDPFLTDGTNKIYINRYINGTWAKELVAENLPLIPSLTVSYIDGKAIIAYTLDTDNSMDTTEDIELYIWSDGEITRLTADSKADSNVQFLDNKLYWTSDSEIMQMTVGDITSTASTGIAGVNDYQILKNATNRAILFIGADGFKNELYLSEETDGTFSTPVPVTDYGNHISDYAAVYRDNGEVTTLLFEREVLNTDEVIYGQTNMHMSETLAAHNLVLNEAWYNMDDMTNDNKLPVNLSLYNASSEAVTSVTVTLEAGSEVLYTETVTCDLAANGITDITINYPVTAAQMGQAITVKAVPANFTDSKLTDNTYEMTLGFADVVLKDFAINYQDGASVMNGTLTNEGYQTAANVSFTVLEGGVDGAAIHTVSCGDLAAGADYDITYTIPSDKLIFTDAFDVKYFHVLCETDNDEDAYGNNSENLAAFPVKVTGLTIDAETLSMTANTTHKLNVTVAPENALDKTVYYISDCHEVAVVLGDGTIIACAEGTATISAITSDGTFVQSCVVTVIAPAEGTGNTTTYEMNTRWASLEVGNAEQLSLSDADGNTVSGITWSSSNTAVATVDENGLVEAKAVGTTYITCTNADNSYYNVCVIHVTSKELQALVFEASFKELTEGETLQMIPAYYPTETTTDKILQWTSSDETVATVSSEGLVTALAGGTTTITATAVNGVTAQFKVTVNALPRYTVTFDSTLGDEPVEISDILGGSTVTLPTQPTREGYYFRGWFTEKDGKGTEFTALTVVNEDLYLYAGWEYIEDGLWVTKITPQTYTGKAIKPTIQVYDGKTLLKEKVDYTISYKNNTKANDATNTKTAPTITVKGKGNYSGKETVTFQILARDITDESIVVTELVKACNNKVQKPVPVITYNGKKLKNKKDFTVDYPDTGADAYKAVGTYTIRVKGIGNFGKEMDIPLVITDDILMSKTKIASIAKQTYTGKAIEPELKVTYKGTPLVKGTDYTVTYKNHTEVGKATAIVTGMGKYAGSKRVTFQIVGQSIAKAAVTDIVEKTYNGQEQIQNPTVTLNGTKLIPGTDYEVTYDKNINAGTAKLTITGKGRYSGTVKKTFKIQAYDLKADSEKLLGGIPKSLTTTYTKGGSTPNVTLTFNEADLVAKKDYTLSYKNNKKPANSTDDKVPMLTIKGKGNFKGSIDIPFTITTKELTDKDNPVTIRVPDMAFNEKAGKFMSKPVLTDSNGKKLKAGMDYEKDIVYTKLNGTVLTKADTPQVGDVIKVTVKGKDYYTGSIETTYKIAQASFTKAKITIKAQSYTGSAITLDADDITVKVGSTKLTQGVDYEIVEDSYTNNVKKGTASVTIKGIGNYGGEKTVKFRIASKNFIWFWNLFQ